MDTPSRDRVLAASEAALIALQRGAALFAPTPAPTVDAPSTRPPSGSQAPCGPILSGEAACPRCGRVRGVVYDGGSVRCFGCHHGWIPTPPAPVVA